MPADNGPTRLGATAPEGVESLPPEFAAFFRTEYRRVLQTVRSAHPTQHEAEEAVSAAMLDVLSRWRDITDPLAYARKAAISHFLKGKTRGLDQVRQRQVACADAPAEGYDDTGFSIWEDRQWVEQMLQTLPPGVRLAGGWPVEKVNAGRSDSFPDVALFVAVESCKKDLAIDRPRHRSGSVRA